MWQNQKFRPKPPSVARTSTGRPLSSPLTDEEMFRIRVLSRWYRLRKLGLMDDVPIRERPQEISFVRLSTRLFEGKLVADALGPITIISLASLAEIISEREKEHGLYREPEQEPRDWSGKTGT